MVDVMGITGGEGDCKAVEKSKYFSLHVNTGHACTYTHTVKCLCVVCLLCLMLISHNMATLEAMLQCAFFISSAELGYRSA